MDRGERSTAGSGLNYLSQFDVLQIRTRLQVNCRQSFDLLNPAGLQAALAAPRQAVFGQELHAGLLAKAAILFMRLIKNHPFYDGNKRIALEALRLFLKRNRYELMVSDAEALHVAQHLATRDVDVASLEEWIEGHLK